MHRGKLLAAMILLLAAAVPARADRPAWVIPDALNVRSGPSTDSDRVGRVTRGDKVTVVAFRGDGWCKARLSNGSAGWLREEYLMFSADKGRKLAAEQGKKQTATPAWVEPNVINVRASADVGASVVCQLNRGAKVYVIDRAGDWRKVKTSGGSVGWIRADLLEFSVEAGRRLAAAPSSSAGSSGPAPAWIKAGVANLRKGPSLGYSRVGQLTMGTKVYVTERQGEWVKISGPEGAGWVHTDLIETNVAAGRQLAASGASGRDKAYCVGNNVALRSGPSTNSSQVASLAEGATVWIKEEKGSWCKVETLDGKDGWMAGWYVRRHGANRTVAQDPDADSLASPGADFPSPDREPEEGKLQPFNAWIAEDNTNVREGASTDRPVLFSLNKRDRVRVLDAIGQWCKVQTSGGQTGWAAGWVLDFQPPGKPEASTIVDGQRVEIKVGWVSDGVVNVRSGQGTDTEIIGQVREGDGLVITAKRDGWLKVLLGNGKAGWIAEHLIESRAERGAEADAPETGEGGSATGRQIVQAAMQYLGCAYVRGAEGPRAFDCSGLTQYVHSKFGISLARTTDGQYRQGRPVDRDELQLGDVVIFRNTYKSGISHVGLYIGQGNFIHASNSRGGVKISALDSSYYASRYAGARRMY